jgi:hypothetical protein
MLCLQSPVLKTDKSRGNHWLEGRLCYNSVDKAASSFTHGIPDAKDSGRMARRLGFPQVYIFDFQELSFSQRDHS